MDLHRSVLSPMSFQSIRTTSQAQASESVLHAFSCEFTIHSCWSKVEALQDSHDLSESRNLMKYIEIRSLHPVAPFFFAQLHPILVPVFPALPVVLELSNCSAPVARIAAEPQVVVPPRCPSNGAWYPHLGLGLIGSNHRGNRAQCKALSESISML